MLDLALICAEPARVKAVLARRGVRPEAVQTVADLDGRWTVQQEVSEALRFRRRRISEEIARRRGAGPAVERAEPLGEIPLSDLEQLGRAVADELHAVEAELRQLEAARHAALLALPNLPATDVPDDEPPAATPPAWPKPFAPLTHGDLLRLLVLAAPPGGPGPSRGWLVWRSRGARLVRGLMEFMLDVHTRRFDYEEVRVPAIASREALTGSAHLPLLEDKMYAIGEATAAGSDLFLAPRAEPHLANLYADQVLEAAALPIRLAAAGRAFRHEAGGPGAAGRGLRRLHEFDTVELYTFCRPDQSEAELVHAVAAAEAVLQGLEVPYRRRVRPARDLSHAAAKTVDLKVWAPGLGEWLEVAALSTFTDYQARRTATRFIAGGVIRKPPLVHTVGGAAVALPHLIAAILENGQEADGSVRLPTALAGYVGEELLGV